jgi:hypothetical protein
MASVLPPFSVSAAVDVAAAAAAAAAVVVAFAVVVVVVVDDAVAVSGDDADWYRANDELVQLAVDFEH